MNLTDFLIQSIVLEKKIFERYKSRSQQILFNIMSKKSGALGKKWRKMKKHWDEESEGRLKGLPYRLKNKKNARKDDKKQK